MDPARNRTKGHPTSQHPASPLKEHVCERVLFQWNRGASRTRHNTRERKSAKASVEQIQIRPMTVKIIAAHASPLALLAKGPVKFSHVLLMHKPNVDIVNVSLQGGSSVAVFDFRCRGFQQYSKHLFRRPKVSTKSWIYLKLSWFN